MRSIRLTRNEAEDILALIEKSPDREPLADIEQEIRKVFGMVSRAEEERVKASMEHFRSIAYPGTFAQWYHENYPEPLP